MPDQKRTAEQLRLLAKLLSDEGGWGQHYIDACIEAADNIAGAER